jgi:hypothetical protein
MEETTGTDILLIEISIEQSLVPEQHRPQQDNQCSADNSQWQCRKELGRPFSPVAQRRLRIG